MDYISVCSKRWVTATNNILSLPAYQAWSALIQEKRFQLFSVKFYGRWSQRETWITDCYLFLFSVSRWWNATRSPKMPQFRKAHRWILHRRMRLVRNLRKTKKPKSLLRQNFQICAPFATAQVFYKYSNVLWISMTYSHNREENWYNSRVLYILHN